MLISPASVMEISIALVGVIGAIAGCIHGSKCTEIKCCGCRIARDIGTNNETSGEETELPTIPSDH